MTQNLNPQEVNGTGPLILKLTSTFVINAHYRTT